MSSARERRGVETTEALVCSLWSVAIAAIALLPVPDLATAVARAGGCIGLAIVGARYMTARGITKGGVK